MMRIVVAPDKFKGSLSAADVAAEIASGLREVIPAAQIQIIPVADGGEGTAEAIYRARGGEWIACKAHDAIGREISARFLWLCDLQTAVSEMSEAAGLQRLSPNEFNPIHASTFGVGEMLLAAAQTGAKKIVLGLGGSATNDGGAGMARACGYRFFDSRGSELTGSVAELIQLRHFTAPADLRLPKIVAAADVRNPLLGEGGATHCFARQKGAGREDMDVLERALTTFANVVEGQLHSTFRDLPGAGAAGGCGFGVMAFCRSEMESGFDIVAEIVNLESAVRDADILVTGEGKLDAQTLEGKAPAGVARLARKAGKRVFAIVGTASSDPEPRALFDEVFSLVRVNMTVEEAMQKTRTLIRGCATELARSL